MTPKQALTAAVNDGTVGKYELLDILLDLMTERGIELQFEGVMIDAADNAEEVGIPQELCNWCAKEFDYDQTKWRLPLHGDDTFPCCQTCAERDGVDWDALEPMDEPSERDEDGNLIDE